MAVTPRLGIPLEDLVDLVTGMPDAREMRHGGDLGLFEQPNHEVVGELAGGPSGTVGHRDERWFQRDEFGDPAIEVHPASRRRRGKELE
jgi:hypothetical protein